MELSTLSQTALEIFSDLLSVASPSGCEEKIGAIVQRRIEEMGFEPEVDPIGNILVRIDGQEPAAGLCLIAAHIDEIGFLVTRVCPDGSLQITRSGGLFPWKIGERPVEILGDNRTITGISSLGSGHSMAADKSIQWEDMKILTGLTAEQLNEAGVRAGSSGVPLRSDCGPIVFGDPADPLVGSWTFDDRMGAVALLRLLEVIKAESITPYHPTIIAFTTHEEIGGQGAKVLAHREKPEVFIAIDGCPMPPTSDIKMDSRPGIWSKDGAIHYDQNLIRFLMKAAWEAGTALQPVIHGSTMSDASMVAAVGAAPRAAVFGHVRENSHGYEVAKLSVFDNVLKVLVQFVRTWTTE